MTHRTCNKVANAAEASDVPPLRALHSLTEANIGGLLSELVRPDEDWCFERHVAHDGHLLLLITPPTTRGSAVSFVLHRSTAGLHLSTWHDDEHAVLGTFRDPGEVGLIIRRVLANGVEAASAAA